MVNFLAVSLNEAEVAAAAQAATVTTLVFAVVVYVVSALSLMFVFKKAGKPAWAAFVPVYNSFVLLEVVGRPLWWFVLFLIPGVNVVAVILVMNDLSKSFGQGTGFTVGLVLLSVIFLFVLGLGSSTYRGPAAAPARSDAYAG